MIPGGADPSLDGQQNGASSSQSTSDSNSRFPSALVEEILNSPTTRALLEDIADDESRAIGDDNEPENMEIGSVTPPARAGPSFKPASSTTTQIHFGALGTTTKGKSMAMASRSPGKLQLSAGKVPSKRVREAETGNEPDGAQGV